MGIAIVMITLYVIYNILSFADLYYTDKRINMLSRGIEILVVILIFVSIGF